MGHETGRFDMSKNIEATGERIRSYDTWRGRLTSLPAETYLKLPYVENSALTPADYPYFGISCVLFPRVFEHHREWTTAQYLEAANNEASRYESHREWLSHLGVPVLAAAIDYDLSKFALKNVVDKSERVVNRGTFVKEVIRQRFKYGRDTNPAIADAYEVDRYSTWHRAALTTDSYVYEVNYIELRNGKPVALIERTQVTRGDLERNFFNFMTRGFAQGMVLLQIAEKLAVKCYLTVYERDMSRVMVAELNREVVEMAQGPSSERNTLSAQYRATEGLSYGHSHGKACEVLYDKYPDLRKNMLAATTHNEYSRAEYQQWLEGM